MIDFAIRMFNFIMAIAQGFLWLTPDQFDAGMWEMAEGIQTALLPASQTVLVIAFIASIYSEHLAEVNRNTVFRLTLRFALAELLVTGCGALVQAIAVFGNWLLEQVTGSDFAPILFTIPENIAALDAENFWDFFTLGPDALFRFVFTLIFVVVCIGSSIIVLLSVVVRFFRLFVSMAIAPVPLAFAGAGSGNDLSRTASRFVSGFIGISVQCIVIWIVFALYAMLIKANILNLLPLDLSSRDLLYAWMINTIVHMLLLVSLTRGADKLVSQLGFG